MGGETSAPDRITVDPWGLSPRVRGKPEIIDSQSPRGKVYPRACGGTF